VLRLIEGEVVSAARQDANRQANAETANLRRQVIAARRQLSAIGQLDLGALPPELAAAAALRMDHPELPLGELAVLGELSKATLAGRLRRLEALVDDV
jgi:DNA-binding protein WhiA